MDAGHFSLVVQPCTTKLEEYESKTWAFLCIDKEGFDRQAFHTPESVTSLHRIAQVLDSTAVRKIPAEPTGFMHGCIYLANAGRI